MSPFAVSSLNAVCALEWTSTSSWSVLSLFVPSNATRLMILPSSTTLTTHLVADDLGRDFLVETCRGEIVDRAIDRRLIDAAEIAANRIGVAAGRALDLDLRRHRADRRRSARPPR